MADNKHLGKTAPDLGRSNVYDSAGDGKTFHLNEIPKWRLGNSYSAGFDYFSNTGENIAESDHGVSESRKQTGSYNNRAFEKSTKSLSATQDTKTAVSSSTRLDQSADYTDDGSSHSSHDENHQEEKMLTWRKMLLDPLTAGPFLSMQWPRISLRASYKRKEPYVAPDEEDADLDLNQKEEKEKITKRRTKCTILAIIIGILLIVIAIVPVIVIANLPQDSLKNHLYVKVNMTVEVVETFTQALKDPNSKEYKSFTNEFCNEIGKVYRNNTSQAYHGCIVSSLKNGSIVVNFITYFIDTTNQTMETNTELILNSYLNDSSSKLGAFTVIRVAVHDVSVERLSSPPPVQIFNPSAVSSTLSILDSAETLNELSTVHSSFAMISSLEILSTLKIEKSSLPMQTISGSISASVTELYDSDTSVLLSTENTPLIGSTVQTELLTSIMTSLIDYDQILTTISDTLISNSMSSTYLPFDSMQSTPLIQNPTSVLTTEVSTIDKMSVPISSTNTMSMTSGFSTEQSMTVVTGPSTTETTPSHQSTEDKITINNSLTDETTSSYRLSTEEINMSKTTASEMKTTTQEMTYSTKENTTLFELSSNESSTITQDTTTRYETYTSTPIPSDDVTASNTHLFSNETMTSVTMPSTSDTSTQLTENTPMLINNSVTEDTAMSQTTTPAEETTTITTSSADITNTSVMMSSTDVIATSVTTQKNTTPVRMSSTDDTTVTVTMQSPTDHTMSTADSTLIERTTSSFKVISNDTTTLTSLTSTDVNMTSLSSSEAIMLTTIGPNATTTDTLSLVLSCNNVTAELYSGPHVMTCTIGTSFIYDILSIKRGKDDTNLEYAMVYHRNGSLSHNLTDDAGIVIHFDGSMTLTVTFKNMSHNFTGKYDIELGTISNELVNRTEGHVGVLLFDGLSCNNVSDAKLNSGPIQMTCTIHTSEPFDYIGFYHGKILEDAFYGIILHKNGTTFKQQETNEDIEVTLDGPPKYILTITFLNVSCVMHGIYGLALMRQTEGGYEEFTGTNGYMQVTSSSGKPTITLNADQVVDLVFPDGNFYRNDKVHKCEGYVGDPSSTLEIDITHNNGTSFEQILDENINLNRSVEFTGCQNMEYLEFALRFEETMDGAKVRCRVSNSQLDFVLSDALSLIPRNICNCGENESFRGHPSNCQVRVFCEEENGIIYPTGIACPSNQCRNSITGGCSDDCSDLVCEKAVPSDFCTTPAPQTTTPTPSSYVSCNNVNVLLNSGPVSLSCVFNDTAFAMINVTFTKLGESEVVTIANIYSNSTIVMLTMQAMIEITLANNIINITIQQTICENEGTFGVVIDINGMSEMDQGKFTVFNTPGSPVLTLSEDQVIDLGFYRDTGAHSCTGIVGYPAMDLILEILYVNTTVYHEIQDAKFKDFKRNTSIASCQSRQEITFGLLFTADMEEATIRCRLLDVLYNETFAESSLSLVPRDICACGSSRSYRGHPGRCDTRVLCLEDKGIMFPRGIVCSNGECRDSITGECTSNCSAAVCQQEVPIDFCTTTTPPTTTPLQSKDISCTDTSSLIYSGPVQIVCLMNKTIFSSINITFRMTGSTDDIPIADIKENKEIMYTNALNNITIDLESDILTITVQNVSCSNDGTFNVALRTEGEWRPPALGRIKILAKPNGIAILKLDPDQIEDLTETRIDRLHTCTAGIGTEAGEVEVEILLEGEETFQTLIPNYMKTPVDTTTNCMTTRTIQFWVHFTTAMYNASIQCKVTNANFPTDPAVYSNTERLLLIPNDFCQINYNGTHNYHHPTVCNRFVTCSEKIVFGKECNTDTLCFRPDIETCDFCRNVDSCP